MNIGNGIATPFKRLVKLYIEDGRLNLTRRLTILMSSLVTALIVMLLIVAVLICGTLAAAYELRQVMSPSSAYALIAGIYVLLILIVILLKRPLIVNPLSRILSRALLNDPTDNTDEL